VDLTPTADSERRVVTLADGSTVSTVGSYVCNLRLTCDTIAVSLKSITIHILPGLAFDVILGYPTIRRYNHLSLFYSLFCEADLQIHNCKSCRQCLPAVFQQECTLTLEATQAEVLRENPRSGAWEVARDCRRLSEGGLNVAVIKDSPLKFQADTTAIQGATRESHRAKEGLDVVTNRGATLRSHRHSEGGIDVASRQARDKQVQYLNAQQAHLESEIEKEFLSGYYARQNCDDLSDLAPVEVTNPTPGRTATIYQT
jgi:hypothetical protein